MCRILNLGLETKETMKSCKRFYKEQEDTKMKEHLLARLNA